MRVMVDPARCQGHTLCAMIAPESFERDDFDGHAHAVVEEAAADEHRDGVLEGVRSCPEQAIAVMIGHVVAARAAHGRRLGR